MQTQKKKYMLFAFVSEPVIKPEVVVSRFRQRNWQSRVNEQVVGSLRWSPRDPIAA
jgi:hypothetical protein